jgi:hypothetical protein
MKSVISSISQKLLQCLTLFVPIVLAQSCFPPNGIFDSKKQTQCVYFIPKTMQIMKRCNEGKVNVISGPHIDVMYGMVKTINGKPSDRFTLFRSSAKMNFPYNLDTIVKDRSKEIKIDLATDKGNGYSYALSIQPSDWTKDTLFFTFYYRQ